MENKLMNLNTMDSNESETVFQWENYTQSSEKAREYLAKVALWDGMNQVSEGDYFTSDDFEQLKIQAHANMENANEFELQNGDKYESYAEYFKWSEEAGEYLKFK
jgi:hypothetical protein